MMNSEAKRNTIIARLILNTHRQKRPNNLIEIARDLRCLEKDLGSPKAVSETIGISTDMIRQFLSVERLSPEVQKLVEERKIDLINVVHYMRNFSPKAQKIIAKKVIAGQLSANDIRVLAPLHNRFPSTSIHKLISRVQRAKNIKIYVAYFRAPTGFHDVEGLKRRFEKVVGKNNIVSFSFKDTTGTLELNSLGQKKLREAAKGCNLTLRKFVDMIVQK
jgi:hypothetical protein